MKKSGVPREEIFLDTKLWPYFYEQEDAVLQTEVHPYSQEKEWKEFLDGEGKNGIRNELESEVLTDDLSGYKEFIFWCRG